MPTNTNPPSDRYCDLVMKGGITSGVVYPKAITRLSQHYRFKNIGGTSAGAIAAAVTAAAEYQRRQSGSRLGFDLLDKLPDQLSSQLPTTGRSKLLSLFQPQPEAKRLFAVLINALNQSSTNRRILAILAGFLLAYWPATLLSLTIAAVVVFSGQGWFTALLVLILLLLTLIAIWVYYDVTKNLVQNGFGLCTGMTADPHRGLFAFFKNLYKRYIRTGFGFISKIPDNEANEALTPWLHKLIQNAAGRKENDAPLTFGDLWKADGFPPAWFEIPRGSSIRSIDLQMFSTNLSHGRPYIFPLESSADTSNEKSEHFLINRERLFFNPEELEQYLPEAVMAWMKKHGKPYEPEPSRRSRDPNKQQAIDKNLFEIPDPENFPVLLAARMSLSFPILFSAVPFWAINYDLKPRERNFYKCWFSDGGISSNFPIHLFDNLVPNWPTFGINLEPAIEGRDFVFLPQKYREGFGERWDLFDDKSDGAAKFGGFLSSIVSAMQNWNDNSLSRMPGMRDRIARVRLKPNEGGLNLDMDQTIIKDIVERGQDAADKLITRFAAEPSGGPQTDGWDEQRLVRLCTLLKMLEERAPGIINSFNNSTAHVTNFATLVENAKTWKTVDNEQEPPPGFDQPLSDDQSKAINDAIAELEKLMEFLSKKETQCAFSAIPKPELRVRPPL